MALSSPFNSQSFLKAKNKKSRFIRKSSSRWFSGCRLANFYSKSYRNVWSIKKEQTWPNRCQNRDFSFKQWPKRRLLYPRLYPSGGFSFFGQSDLVLTAPNFFENHHKLERVDKDLFAMSVCTVDGQRFHLGLVSMS